MGDKRTAGDKLSTMIVITLLKWLIWCLIHRPEDFMVTVEEFTEIFEKLGSPSGNSDR